MPSTSPSLTTGLSLVASALLQACSSSSAPPSDTSPPNTTFGAAQDLIAQVRLPGAIASDGTNVYVLDGAYGDAQDRLLEVPSSGGSTATVSGSQTNGRDVLLDASYAYWSGWAGAILRAPLGGGQTTTLRASQGLADTTNGIRGMAIDSTHLYFTAMTAPLDGSIAVMPLGGGSVTTLASGRPTPRGLVVSGGTLYWAEDGAIASVPTAGGNVTSVATFPGMGGEAIAADSSNLYASFDADTGSTSLVVKVPLGGGAATTLASASVRLQPYLALDASGVYWPAEGPTLQDSGSIMMVPLQGGAPVSVAAVRSPTAVAVDATHVYFSDWSCTASGTSGCVKSVTKTGS